jgi:hypothetical protein
MSFPYKTPLALTGIALAGMLTGSVANAETENVAVLVEFVAPIVLTEESALSFGTLDVTAEATDTVTIDPDDTVTDASNIVLGGTQSAASLTVEAGNGVQDMSIQIQNVTPGAGYSLASWSCEYAGVNIGDCSSAQTIAQGNVQTSTTLDIGATLTPDGPSAGNADGSFDVVIAYL